MAQPLLLLMIHVTPVFTTNLEYNRFVSSPPKTESANVISSFTFQQVVSAIRSGVNPAGTLTNHSSLWDLSSAFFFAGTVITTIGGLNTCLHIHTHTRAVCVKAVEF